MLKLKLFLKDQRLVLQTILSQHQKQILQRLTHQRAIWDQSVIQLHRLFAVSLDYFAAAADLLDLYYQEQELHLVSFLLIKTVKEEEWQSLVSHVVV